MQRNILVCYILTFLRFSWFWLGIWVFYYLRFTNYAGIGLLESYQVIAISASQVPTGAIADIFGKRITLTFSFIFLTIGMAFFAFSPSVFWLLFAVVIAGIGGTLFSGTTDALLYDSLKEMKKEEKFGAVISRMTSISLLAPAVCGIIGGFLYTLHPNFPYIAQGICCAIGAIVTLWLYEPKIKEQSSLSFDTFFQQTKYGFYELFKNTQIIKQTILLFSIGTVSVICFEMLNDFLAVEFTFKPTQLALLWSIFYVICALISHATPLLGKYISYKNQAILIGFLMAITLIVSPIGGIIVGGLSILFRASLQTLFNNVSSVLINQHVDPKYRTTTLSTFSLVQSLPYVFTAFLLGSLADTFSAIRIAFFLGLILLTFMAIQKLILLNKPSA